MGSFMLFTAPFVMFRLMRNKRLKPRELKRLQDKKLKALIEYSYRFVPRYHQLFKENKLMPDDIKTIDDLHKIPISRKMDIIDLPIEEIVSSGLDLHKCLKVRTSGTTCTPMDIYWQKKVRMVSKLSIYKWQLECGDKMTDKHVVIGASWFPNSPALLQKFGIFNTKRISIHDNPETQIEQILKFKPKTIETIGSCVIGLAKEVLEKDIEGLRFHLIFTGGEMLEEDTRRLAKDIFDAEIFDGYGAREAGTICQECVTHIGYHTLGESVIVEVTRNGETVSTGEEGEITVTNLDNYATPSIRYNLEDLGVLIDDKCSCGKSFPLMRVTGGRKRDVVQLPNGRRLSALAVYGGLAFIQGIKQFQLIQEKNDYFSVRIVKGREFTDKTVNEIIQKLRQRLGNVQAEVSVTDNIPREKSGKFRPFVTNVPLNDNGERMQKQLSYV
jgi:phenylacetate-CoA ligase